MNYLKSLAIIILAAGKGKRMKSTLPKVLHTISGRPMLSYVLDLAKSLDPEKLIVVSSEDERMLHFLREQGFNNTKKTRNQFVIQELPLGTADAVKKTEKTLDKFQGDILILSGDVILLKKQTISELIKTHRQRNAELTLLTSIVPDPELYGRVVRAVTHIVKIIEDTDATPEQKLIAEINTGIYVFNKKTLFNALKEITQDNAQEEYYLTDTIEIIRNKDLKVVSYTASDYRETLGINTPEALSEVREFCRMQKSRIKEDAYL